MGSSVLLSSPVSSGQRTPQDSHYYQQPQLARHESEQSIMTGAQNQPDSTMPSDCDRREDTIGPIRKTKPRRPQSSPSLPTGATIIVRAPTGDALPVDGNSLDNDNVANNLNGLNIPPSLFSESRPTCAGCQNSIKDRYLLCALDKMWHEDCLKCGSCDCRLGEVGSTLYFKNNLILCRRDYLRIYGTAGLCSACHKTIPSFEMVMRARSNVYHLECFACQQCNHRFCVGDRFYLHNNRILCEDDYSPLYYSTGA